MRGKQTGAANGRQHATFKSLVAIFAVSAAFALGLGIGNGSIDLPKQYASRTGLPEELDYSSVDQVYESLKDNYNGKLSADKLVEGMKHGLAEAANDPYTVYFTSEEAESFNQDLQNTFSGIGAELGKNDQGNIQIIAPIKDTPADKAGLRAKDIIATVNGKTTVGMSIDDAVKAIRGEAGTTVTLQIVRGDEALTVPIVRQTIQVPSVTHEIKDGGVGYIQISNFANDTAVLVRKAALEFKQQNVKKIVLDLRNNPGGQVDAAINVASEWLPTDKLIMQEKRGQMVTQTYKSTGTNTLGGIPTVVLINGGSASASEIVAAALHDNGQARLIGVKTYGKGVVQSLINLGDGSELKVTTASWHRPNGKNINNQGIQPNQKVVISDADAEAENDTQLQAALQYLAK